MKKMLDGLYLVLGTLCLFGLPSAILALSAWFGDGVMATLHTSASAMHSVLFQVEAIVIVFGTSAGGMLIAMGAFAALWLGVQAIARMAARLEPVPNPAAGRVHVKVEAPEIGRINHSGTHRRV
jgi:hypothetical protein